MMSFLQDRVSNNYAAGIVALVLLLVSTSHAQPIARSVPFTLSASDTTSSVFLPHIEEGPAGKHGPWHLSPDGHFQSADGSQSRFVGTELQWNAVFQTSENARILAKRLAKMGFNAVRFNDWDYWGYDDYSFFRTYDDKGAVQNTSYAINPVQLARFDTLLYELKQAGIYVFLPLHSAHGYRPADGVPTWDSTYYNGYLMPALYPEAANKQREFAGWLAAHVNPLTGIALGRDPQIACWEIEQEFSLPFYWQLGRLNYIDTTNALTRGSYTISYHQSRHLDTLFNSYLSKKYGSDAAINAAWGGSAVDERNLIDNGSFDSFDMNRWTLSNVAPARSNALLVSPGEDNSPAVMIHIAGLDTTGLYYGNIFTNASVVLGRDSLYQYSFWAKLRIDPLHPVSSRTLRAYIAQTESGSGNLVTEVAIDTTWKRYTFTFRCAYPGAQVTGVLFSGEYGDVVLDNFSIQRLPEIGLRPGESLVGMKIQRLAYAEMKNVSAARARDLTEFYVSLERGYFEMMQRTLRDTLNVAGLINRTQTNYWGTLPDYYSLKDGEVTIAHAGWDYPSAPLDGTYTDSTWMIRNYALVRDAGLYALANTAAASTVGKAHILGGWTVPNNNQSSSENALIPLAYAALQDWDGIFFSPYAVRRDQVLADSLIPGYETYAWSNIAPNHTFMALMPAASEAFRTHAIATSTILDTIHHDASDVFLYPHYSDYRGMFGQEGFQYGDQGILTYLPLRQRYDSRHQLAAENYYTPGDSLNRSETGEISYAPTLGYFRIETPTLYGYTGFPRTDIEFPKLRLRRTDNSGDILSFYYRMDTTNHRALFSIGTRTQNTGMKWLDSTSYGKSNGHSPTIMSAARLEMSIVSNEDALEIQPLDSTGNLFGKAIPATPVGHGTFNAAIDQLVTPATWFYVAPPSTNGVVEISDAAGRVRLIANPVSDWLVLVGQEPLEAITIVDALGREVSGSTPGSERARIDVRDLPAEAYTAVVQTAHGPVRKRFTVLR